LFLFSLLLVALGLGAALAVAALYDRILLRPLPMADTRGVVTLTAMEPSGARRHIPRVRYRTMIEPLQFFNGVAALTWPDHC
jgi:hypothetical protein